LRDKGDIQAREVILKAARQEFAQMGFQGARMSHIAKNAKVNKALIHYYFKNKENLYKEVLQRVFGVRKDFDIPIYTGQWDLTPSQKLYVAVYFLVKLHLNATSPDLFRIIFWELAEGNLYSKDIIVGHNMPRTDMLFRIIQEGIEKGDFFTENPQLAVMNLQIFMSTFGLNKDIHFDSHVYNKYYGDLSNDDMLSFTIENVFKTLRPPNRTLKIPDVPGDLMELINKFLDLLHERKEEGISELFVEQVNKILND